MSALNPMETGICQGIPLQFLESQFPGAYVRWALMHMTCHPCEPTVAPRNADEYARWSAAPNRAAHRITGGESLMDVVARLSPVVIEIERSRSPVLVVSHLSTLQVLLAYFQGVPVSVPSTNRALLVGGSHQRHEAAAAQVEVLPRTVLTSHY